MQVSLISSITSTHNPNQTIDSIEELANGRTITEEKPFARSDSSKTSLPEANTNFFPGCSQWDIDELRLILVADKRSKDDIQLLSRKLKDNPLIKTLIKRLKLEDDQEAYIQLFKLLKLEEYPEGHRVYEQKDLSNSKAYLVFQGEVLKIQHTSPEEKNDQKEPTHMRTQVSNLGSRIEFDDLSPGLPGLSPGLLGANLSSRTPKAKKMLEKSRTKILDLQEIPEEDNRNTFTPSMKREQRFSALLIQQNQDKEHHSFVNALELFIKKGLSTSKANLGDKAENVKNIAPGGHFGQKALWSMQKRDHTVITKTKCEFIVLTADALKAIKKTLETNKKRLVQFLSGCFPLIDLENDSRVFNHIMESFTCKIFAHNQNIEVEGQNLGECFYIIYQGQCEILKKIVLENNTPVTSPFHDIKSFFALTPNNVEHMNIFTINEGSFFGDEVLFSHYTKSSYTIRVLSSEAKVLAFDKTKFLAKAPKEVLVQLRDHYLRKQEKNCDILVQNLFLRGYSLDRQAFLEENKIVLEPLKESKFRTFYHQARTLRDSQAFSPSESSHITLDNIKDRVNEQYAHKLRLANNSGSKTPRIMLEPLGSNSPRVGSMFTSMTPREKTTTMTRGGNFSPRVGGMQSPSYYLGSQQQQAKPQWPNLDKSSKGGHNSNENSKTMENSSSLNNHLPLTLASERAKKLDPIMERRDSEKHAYKNVHSEPDQAPDLVRLKFLQGEESKKGLKNFLKSRSHKNSQKDETIFKGKVDYAEIMKTHYKTKFIGSNSNNDSCETPTLRQEYKVYTEEKPGRPQLAKPQLHIALPEPILDPRKTVPKVEPVNIHMKHEKRKLNPLQRSKNRTDIVFKSPRSKE